MLSWSLKHFQLGLREHEALTEKSGMANTNAQSKEKSDMANTNAQSIPPKAHHSRPRSTGKDTSYTGAVRNFPRAKASINSGISFPNQSLGFIKLSVKHERVKVIPPKGISDEGRDEWENTQVRHFKYGSCCFPLFVFMHWSLNI
jgi:hypothetical protein